MFIGSSVSFGTYLILLFVPSLLRFPQLPMHLPEQTLPDWLTSVEDARCTWSAVGRVP